MTCRAWITSPARLISAERRTMYSLRRPWIRAIPAKFRGADPRQMPTRSAYCGSRRSKPARSRCCRATRSCGCSRATKIPARRMRRDRTRCSCPMTSLTAAWFGGCAHDVMLLLLHIDCCRLGGVRIRHKRLLLRILLLGGFWVWQSSQSTHTRTPITDDSIRKNTVKPLVDERLRTCKGSIGA